VPLLDLFWTLYENIHKSSTAKPRPDSIRLLTDPSALAHNRHYVRFPPLVQAYISAVMCGLVQAAATNYPSAQPARNLAGLGS
jgi:hypothetical protein